MASNDRDEPQVVVVERREGGTLAFLVGALVGGILGVLFAPGSGAETRRAIRRRAGELRDAAEETLGDTWTQARRQIDEGLAAARDVVERQAEEVREVLEAGRAAARETRREVRRRRARPERTPSPSEAGERESSES